MPQDHIHLSRFLEDNGELAPDMKWHIISWEPVPEAILDFAYHFRTGQLLAYSLEDSSGPVLFQNMNYRIKLEPEEGMSVVEREALLVDMNDQTVYFCDVFHADDGEDHTSDIQQALCRVGELENTTSMLDLIYVDIELRAI